MRHGQPETVYLLQFASADLLTLEATGDYAAMLDRLGRLTPELQRAIDKLRDIPTDIDPVFVTADRISR